MSDHYRRTDPRYTRRLEVQLVAGEQTRTGMTGNISLGGLFVETNDPLPMQTRVQIRFHIPTQPEIVEVNGEVRWFDPGGPDQPAGLGIRFQGLRAREVWALNRFFQA